MNAFMLNLGLESLHVRMQRHCENGHGGGRVPGKPPQGGLRQLLRACPAVPTTQLAQKYLPNGSCGVVSFGLKGGREAASTFMKALKLAAIETHVADARTCCLNPASPAPTAR